MSKKKVQAHDENVIMTRPDGQPANVPCIEVARRLKEGYKIGYKEPEMASKAKK